MSRVLGRPAGGIAVMVLAVAGGATAAATRPAIATTRLPLRAPAPATRPTPGASTARGARGAAPRATAAHALRAADTAHLRYVSAVGSVLDEVGSANGTLPGSMRVHLRLAAVFSGSFTIYTRGGSISGHGSAVPHGSGRYESFVGTIVTTGGTGRFAHARGSARLYGTFDRETYALAMQTAGTLYY